MTDRVSPIPPGFHTLTPSLIVKDADRAIAFYVKAFGATELTRNTCETSKLILNAQLRIGNSIFMLNDEFPDFGAFGPSADRPSSVTVYVATDDVDGLFERAVAAGAEVTMPVADMFWGDRYGAVRDPFGHNWSIGTRIEELSEQEIKERTRHAFA